MRRAAAVAGLALAAVVGPGSVARGYNEAIHSLLDERAPPRELAARTVAAPTVAAMDALRVALWRAGSSHPDAAVRAAFLARWPEEAKFDRWAMKELLGLTPEHEIFGIDRLPPGAPATVGALLVLGAREPDDDRRNRDRFAHDAARVVKKDRWDRPVPLDPKQLDLGARSGTASQAWAHYGLPKVEFSAEPSVLKREPWRWSYAQDPRAFAPHFADVHTDLALCAASLDEPAGEGLAWLIVGQAHHYVEDVANQIHTLQAIYPFFFDAKLQAIYEDLRSVGGLLRSRPSFVDVGIQIITNHHLVGEDLFAARVADAIAGRDVPPGVAAALAAITSGDPELERDLDGLALSADQAFAGMITQAVIERSSREGGLLYEATRQVVSARLSKANVAYEDPPAEVWARKHATAEEWATFYDLQRRGFARAGSALRRHVALVDQALAPGRADPLVRRARLEATAQRLVATRLAVMAEAEARLAAWVVPPPAAAVIAWWVPGFYAGLLALVGLIVWRVRVRRRRRRAA